MAGHSADVVFDLADVSRKYYREHLRLGRWVGTAGFLFIVSLIAVSLATAGPNAQPPALFFGFAILAGAFAYGAFVYAVPGPTELVVRRGSLDFRFKSGKVRHLATRPLRVRVKLVERVGPPTAARFRVDDDPGLFADIGIRRVPLTKPALDAISEELTASGNSRVETRRSDPHIGDWRILSFRHAR